MLTGRVRIPKDLDRLKHFELKNIMKFNRDKCEVLQLGQKTEIQLHLQKIKKLYLLSRMCENAQRYKMTVIFLEISNVMLMSQS